MKTYWNNEGRFEAEYNEMRNAGFNFTKAEQNAFHRYYRYFNDGDLPMGAKYAWTRDIEMYLEAQVSIAIAKAYVRFKKGNVVKAIKFYSKSSLKGFNAWMNVNA